MQYNPVDVIRVILSDFEKPFKATEDITQLFSQAEYALVTCEPN